MLSLAGSNKRVTSPIDYELDINIGVCLWYVFINIYRDVMTKKHLIFFNQQKRNCRREKLIIAVASYIICLGSHFVDTQNKLQQRATERRDCWVSHTHSKRSKFGAYHSTMAQLEVSQAKEWRNYMRMDKNLFTSLLQFISADIRKQDTSCRLAIPPSERLAVTLRYLATGEGFTTLHYQF